MSALSALTMFFQDSVTLASDVHSLVIAEWIIAICVLLVVVGLVVAAITVLALIRNVEKKVNIVTKSVESKATPLIAQGQELLTKVKEIVADLQPKIASVSTDVQHTVADLKPKIEAVTSDVQHMSGVVKSKIDEISGTVTKIVGEVSETVTQVNGTVQDVNGKTQAQVGRVNGMVSEALNTTEHVSRSIQHGVRVPIEKVVGWVAAAKVGIDNLGDRVPFLGQMMGKKAQPTRTKSTQSTAGGRPIVVPSASKSEG